MAEFLIYNKTHWMDALTNKQKDELRVRDKYFDTKYNARYQKGDIIEVRPDGYWTGQNARGFDTSAFKVVSVPGLEVDTTKMQSVLGNVTINSKTSTNVLIKRRRFAIPAAAKVGANIVNIKVDKLAVTDKVT